LTVPADPDWVPLLQSAAENAARVFGLAREKGLRLAMSMEEVLLYLASALPGATVRISLEQAPGAVSATFSLTTDSLDLSAMNIVAEAEPNEHGHVLPPVLASRMSDGLHVFRTGTHIHLTLRQDQVYKRITPAPEQAPLPCTPVRVESTTDIQRITHACARLLGRFPKQELPPWIAIPGKILDRSLAGELQVVVALDDADRVRAILFWEYMSEKSVTFSGPWLLDACDQGIAPLLEHMLLALARTKVSCLFSNPDGTPAGLDLSTHGFELLATITRTEQGRERRIPVWFRQLQEDEGLQVWSHPGCVPFLEATYQRVFLPRSILPVTDVERRPQSQAQDRSLFAAKMNREMGEMLLRPLLDGADNAENISRHLRVLRGEGYQRILFRIDLAEGWQAALCGDLLEQGCRPSLVLPLAGRSDVLLLEYVQTAP
jgi:hypothetical protein